MALALVLLGLVLEDDDLLVLILRNHFSLDAYGTGGFADDNLVAVNQHQRFKIDSIAYFGFDLIKLDN